MIVGQSVAATLRQVDSFRLGRIVRALRHRREWTQAELAKRAGVSQNLVSRIEIGRADDTPFRRVRATLQALDADAAIAVRWRAGDLDRLMDEGHGALVGATMRRLDGAGWDPRPEVSYSVYGERGSIDILARHPASGSILVVEVKTELTSVEETLRKHDEKARLGPRIGAERFGWTGGAVGRLLVLPDVATARRRVQRHGAVLDSAYRARGSEIRSWLRSPSSAVGAMSGLLFLPVTHDVRGRCGSLRRQRVRSGAAAPPRA